MPANERGREEPQRDRPRRHRRRRLPRRHTRSCGSRTWTATACAASVIYGPLSLGFPIDDPALQDACYAAWNDWAVEEFNAVAPDRLCVLAFLPGHSPEAAAAELERCAALGHRGAIVGVFDIDVGDPAWDRLWAAARAHRAADQLPHQGRHLVEAELPDRQVAVGGVRVAAAAAARRAARDDDVLAARSSGTRASSSCSRSRASGWLPYFLTRMDLEWQRAARQARLRAEHRAERAVPPPGDGHVRGGAARGAVHPAARRRLVHVGVRLPAHRQHVPESRRAIEETLGSLPAPIAARSPRPTAPALRLPA